MRKRIYLDNNATAPLDPRIEAVFVEALQKAWANPSSTHSLGQEARALFIDARELIAHFFGFSSPEVIFTSSGTEAVNLVLRGLFGFRPQGHIVTSAVEHPCVYNTVQALERAGVSVTYINPGLYGAVTAEQVEAALRNDTKCIVLMAANNETGVKTDIDAIAALALSRNIPFIVDAVALLGKEPFHVHEGVSALCCSGHKIHAPKGTGLALVRKRLRLEPYLTGGGQEGGLRSGTENVAAACALAEAIRILKDEGQAIKAHIQGLREYFEKELLLLPDVEINGIGPRTTNTSNICFQGVEGEILLMRLDLQGVLASHGSACTSGAQELSRVLLQMGIPRKKVLSSIRFSLSRFNTKEEIAASLEIISSNVRALRSHF